MDEQRAILDALMGADRDGEAGPSKVKHFTDDDVCPYFLCGMCPHEMFTNTKLSLGDCPKLHLDLLKTQYEAEREKTGNDYGYEVETMKYVKELVDNCDRKIRQGQERLAMNTEVDAMENASKVDTEIKQLMTTVENLAEQGKVEESMMINERIEELRNTKPMAENLKPEDFLVPGEEVWKGTEADVESIITTMRSQPHAKIQKLRVCGICGAYLSIFDNETRITDHFRGKTHLGFLQMRTKLKEAADLNQLLRDRSRDRDRTVQEREAGADRDHRHHEHLHDRSRGNDRGHHRGRRDYNHDRDYYRDRDHRDRSRGRDYRGRDGGRDYRDGGRSHYRDRDNRDRDYRGDRYRGNRDRDR